MKQIIDSLVIGGVPGELPRLPGMRLQQLLGTTIEINMLEHKLYVPTDSGIKVASTGDKLVLYVDNTLDVIPGAQIK